MTKNNYGIKHGRQGRPRVITKVHDVDKTRSCPIEATSRKCHVQKNTKKNVGRKLLEQYSGY